MFKFIKKLGPGNTENKKTVKESPFRVLKNLNFN